MSGTAPVADDITLIAGGMAYRGWAAITLDRQIDRMASHFSIAVTEAWASADPNATKPWQITPFTPCQVKIGTDVVLTGYVDEYNPSYDAESHTVSISGRGKTEDLVDCMPDIPSGQFKGYTLAAIARAVAAPFSINVVVQTDASQVFPDATLQRCETAFAFLERLGRLAAVLLTDDVNGNLVLTTAGSTRSAGSLAQGVNILRASATLSGARRFSQYIVKGQRALGSAAGQSGAVGGGGTPTPVVTNLRAVALDTNVPRYRPKITLAEAQLDAAGMQRRANWERNYAAGRGTEAEITVLGWRSNGPGSPLWDINTLVTVTSPFLQLDQDLLIVGVGFSIDDHQGRITRLKVSPVGGYTPDPGQVKIKGKKGSGPGGQPWAGAGGS